MIYKVKKNSTLKAKKALQGTLLKINENNIYNDTIYLNLYPKGSKQTRLYGTPKIQKAFLPSPLPPFQPIVSSVGTYNYSLAQYLGPFLSLHIPSKYPTKDSFTFVEEI